MSINARRVWLFGFMASSDGMACDGCSSENLSFVSFQIWHSNMPHNKIADRKGHQGWMKREGPYFIFTGGGTMFPDGAEQYIEKLGQYIPFNKGVLRTALDMGCGVASFGWYLLSKDILTLSFAPRDSHKSQIQFALERGTSFCVDAWHTKASFSCLLFRLHTLLSMLDPLYCLQYFKLKICVTRISSVKAETAVGVIPTWPARLTKAPARAALMKNGKDVFDADTKRWARRVSYYKKSLNTNVGTPAVRNIMDMNAFFGGFATALLNACVGDECDTCTKLINSGCEPFSTYPRTYDLLHVSGIESLVKSSGPGKNRCNLVDLMVEMDRILRPEGTVVIRDTPDVNEKAFRIAHAIRWKTTVHDKEPESHANEKILVATKSLWKLPSASQS